MLPKPKGTLFFYDKEGLLKPRYVSANGYRRYGAEQFFEYDMISLLKETGSSLEEIRLHLQKRDSESLLRLFDEKRIELDRHAAKLARQQKMLDAIVSLTRATLHSKHDELEMVDLEEEALELMPVDPENQTTAEGCAMLFAEFSRKLEEQGRFFSAPFGVLVEKDEVTARRYVASHFFCGGSASTPLPSLHIRPRGRYASFLHSGDKDSHKRAYAAMLERIERSGLAIAGNAYSYDTMSYFITGSTEKYMARYCIRVR